MTDMSAPAAKPHRKPRGGKPGERRNRPLLRRNVGMVIMGPDGRVLAGLRAHANGDKAWQLPQGGIEGRERPLVAVYRELREETGLVAADVEFLAELPRWTVYFLPRDWTRGRRFAGQKQKWFIFRYLKDELPDLALAKDKEFEALDWVNPDWLVQHVIDFRKPVYRNVFDAFAAYLKPHDKPHDKPRDAQA